MSETTGTIEAPSYQKQIQFTKPPEAVFEALTAAAGVAGWWVPTTGSGVEGGELRLTFPPGPGVMRVDTAQPSSTVVWTVLVCDFLPDWVGTQIIFVLHPSKGGGTTLEFRHQGLTPQLECYEQCQQGWDYYLPSLRGYVETGAGRPGPRPRAAS
jgi:uncharacterized protein YndB with AHSA1/START domain